MAYSLGIDVGTTFTAAAIVRSGRPEMVVLGTGTAAIPTMVHIGAGDSVLVGDGARRRLLSDPGDVVREFKRRLGDSTPVFVAGAPRSAEHLLSLVLRWVVDRVTEQEGGPPDHVTVTHPANWGPYRRELFDQALRLADLPDARTATEPEAAAIAYASTERVEPGELVAVYDLGGGTFDAAVLRKGTSGFDVLGTPEGIEHLGGLDFDGAVLNHVRGLLGGAVERLDPDDPAAVRALQHLREQCTAAKEALSFDSQATVPVLLPGLQTEVAIDRATFEAVVRPLVDQSAAAMQRALTSAGVDPSELRAIVLVGGSSRIPLIAEVLAARFGCRVALDTHPKHAVALGAAMAAAGWAAPVVAPLSVAPEPATPVPATPAPVAMPLPPPPPGAVPWSPAAYPQPSYPTPPPHVPAPTPTPSRPWWRRTWVLVTAAILVLAVIGSFIPDPDEEVGADGTDGQPAASGTTTGDGPDATEPAIGTTPVTGQAFAASSEIAAGDCFDEPVAVALPTGTTGTTEAGAGPEVSGAALLDCAEPHRYEATGSHELDGADETYPPMTELSLAATAPCEARFAEHVGATGDASVLESFPLLFPTATSWAEGERSVLCVAVSDRDVPLRGTVRGQGASDFVRTFDLEVGNCFFDREEGATDVARVACTAPHDNEVVGFVELDSPDGTPYPGDDAVLDAAEQPCEERFVAHVGRPTFESPFQAIALYFPSEDSWRAGGRRVTCVAYADDVGLVTQPAGA